MIKIEMNTESLMDATNPDPNNPQVEIWRVLIRATHADYAITMLPPAEINDQEGKAIELILLGKKNGQIPPKQ